MIIIICNLPRPVASCFVSRSSSSAWSWDWWSTWWPRPWSLWYRRPRRARRFHPATLSTVPRHGACSRTRCRPRVLSGRRPGPSRTQRPLRRRRCRRHRRRRRRTFCWRTKASAVAPSPRYRRRRSPGSGRGATASRSPYTKRPPATPWPSTWPMCCRWRASRSLAPCTLHRPDVTVHPFLQKPRILDHPILFAYRFGEPFDFRTRSPGRWVRSIWKSKTNKKKKKIADNRTGENRFDSKDDVEIYPV